MDIVVKYIDKLLAPFFWLSEVMCNDGSPFPSEYMENAINLALKVTILRLIVGVPFHVSSWWRSVKHNKAVGGSPTSQHLTAKAMDVHVKLPEWLSQDGFANIAFNLGLHVIIYDTFFHLDIRDGEHSIIDLRKGAKI